MTRTERDALVVAAFFMDGLHEAKPNLYTLTETWGYGYLELVETIINYVPLTVALCEAGYVANDSNCPGVFDYEVSAEFGKWFGEHIIKHGEEPSEKVARRWLADEAISFFTQGTESAENTAKIKEAVENVLINHKE